MPTSINPARVRQAIDRDVAALAGPATRYRETTRRLVGLGCFLSHFAPSIGARPESELAGEVDVQPAVEAARQAAVVAAFAAVERIASESLS
jgi:hypothetical protein